METYPMRLVVQGPEFTENNIQEVRELLGDSSAEFVKISDKAVYFPAVESLSDDVKQYCKNNRLDVALVADEMNFENLGLIVMDMDSTLITIECIDEIADMHGLKPQVAEITESAMRGEIEFQESLRRRVALLNGLESPALKCVIDERLCLTPGAKELIDACKANGVKTLLVSGGFDFFASHVQELLGIDDTRANTLEIVDGKLTGKVLGDIVDAQAKAVFLEQFRQELGLRKDQTIAVGDGANDLKMMEAAGAGVAFHAKPIVQEQATFAVNYMGLDGVVNILTK